MSLLPCSQWAKKKTQGAPSSCSCHISLLLASPLPSYVPTQQLLLPAVVAPSRAADQQLPSEFLPITHPAQPGPRQLQLQLPPITPLRPWGCMGNLERMSYWAHPQLTEHQSEGSAACKCMLLLHCIRFGLGCCPTAGNSVDAAVLSAVLRGLRSKPLNKEIQGATGVSPSTIYNGLRALTANSEFMSALKFELIKVRAQAAANSGSQQLGDRYSPGSLTQQTRGDSSIPNNSSSPYHNTIDLLIPLLGDDF